MRRRKVVALSPAPHRRASITLRFVFAHVPYGNAARRIALRGERIVISFRPCEGELGVAIVRWLTSYTVWLCRSFDVTPDYINRNKRGNLPPPTGGIGAY
jgi:hypothetical protein